MVDGSNSVAAGIDSRIIESLNEAGAEEELSSDLWAGALTCSTAKRIGRHRVLVVHSFQPTDLIGSFPMGFGNSRIGNLAA